MAAIPAPRAGMSAPARLAFRRDAGCERLGGVAGGNSNVAFRRDAHGEFGVDQVEALGAEPPYQQCGTRQPHFGLRRAGDDGVVAIADDDVADAHGDADLAGTLDLGAADLDRIAVADIVLDRGGKPRRRNIEIDRPGAEPPPQPAEAAGEDDRQRGDHNRKALYPALAADPSLRRCDLVASR